MSPVGSGEVPSSLPNKYLERIECGTGRAGVVIPFAVE
jgi:hypothetical protein